MHAVWQGRVGLDAGQNAVVDEANEEGEHDEHCLLYAYFSAPFSAHCAFGGGGHFGVSMMLVVMYCVWVERSAGHHIGGVHDELSGRHLELIVNALSRHICGALVLDKLKVVEEHKAQAAEPREARHDHKI